ncbi:hypothetical protein TROPICALSUN_47 [Erwinia phage vB_EamM_TropicalSun]|uniref:Uncharacterized protein n=1 Tax=Erwinia phage vB_EamM_TropicalSun TaxID=2591372 RepID=A0A5B9NI05_9CAUD|nr:hypothetical protein TROPICALSUN_47 [Erwinia phage vB_EamM_TropicalSun]
MTDVDRFADGEVVYHVSEKGTIRRGTCDEIQLRAAMSTSDSMMAP